MCCTDYGVICVCRGVFRGYLVDIAVLFCSYWSKMEYMSILSVQLWQGVLSSMLPMMLDMVLFLSVFMACVLWRYLMIFGTIFGKNGYICTMKNHVFFNVFIKFGTLWLR